MRDSKRKKKDTARHKIAIQRAFLLNITAAPNFKPNNARNL